MSTNKENIYSDGAWDQQVLWDRCIKQIEKQKGANVTLNPNTISPALLAYLEYYGLISKFLAGSKIKMGVTAHSVMHPVPCDCMDAPKVACNINRLLFDFTPLFAATVRDIQNSRGGGFLSKLRRFFGYKWVNYKEATQLAYYFYPNVLSEPRRQVLIYIINDLLNFFVNDIKCTGCDRPVVKLYQWLYTHICCADDNSDIYQQYYNYHDNLELSDISTEFREVKQTKAYVNKKQRDLDVENWKKHCSNYPSLYKDLVNRTQKGE